jgi:4-hydroxy-tetrahydrodipicolinate synthase
MNNTIDNGVWPVMITPYTNKNEIDYDGVLQILDWYSSQQVTGIFAVCQSSEMHYLSRKERIALARFVLKNAPGGMGIIVSGHVSKNIKEQIEDAKEIIGAGADAYVFISNQFAGEDESDDCAKKNIERLLTAIPGARFGIYECPHPYKRLLTPELLKWAAETGCFSFLKDTCCNLSMIKAKIKAVEGSNLKIYNANAATLLESLKSGAAGYSGVMANFHASLYVWLCAHFKERPEIAAIVQDVLGFASLVEYQLYPVNAKYHMQLEGVEINLFSRVQDYKLLTKSQKMQIEQMRRSVDYIKKMILKQLS